ncbi:MAG TPA: UPF0182 family protein, partial [Candidatus Binataceae bacterium]|nr:UPF0182 family protein [Candidatus Binataceae bacterium]
MAQRRSVVPMVITIVIVAVSFVVLPLLGWFAQVWTDYLWYADLGQSSVFVTRIVSQIAIAVGFGVAAFGLLFANMRIARGMAPKVATAGLPGLPANIPIQIEELLDLAKSKMGPILDKAILYGALVLAFLNGTNMADQWETFRLWLGRIPFGATDPQFGRDIGLWVFTLPAAEALLAWLTGILFLTTLLTLVVHVLDGAIQPWARARGFA